MVGGKYQPFCPPGALGLNESKLHHGNSSVNISVSFLLRSSATVQQLLMHLDANSSIAVNMDLHFIAHQGTSSLSEFRRQLLASKIGALRIEARYIHYVALYDGVNDRDQETLQQLLTSGEASQDDGLGVREYPK